MNSVIGRPKTILKSLTCDLNARASQDPPVKNPWPPSLASLATLEVVEFDGETAAACIAEKLNHESQWHPQPNLSGMASTTTGAC